MSAWPRHAAAAGGLAALAIALSVGAPAVAAQPLPRVAYVASALAAVRELGAAGRNQLERELYAAARTQCRADTATPSARCLIAASRAACAGDPDRRRCEAVADVIVANLRAANSWVDEPTRIRLVRGSTDYRAALAAELRRRHAALAAELVLTARGDDAVAIDQLCAERDRAIHACLPGDAACVPSLPWSRCVAALIWFVGGTP